MPSALADGDPPARWVEVPALAGELLGRDIENGEMLAMVSMPAYDPNSFSDGISHLEWKMLSDNDHVPLMNKVLQGLYPPGSTVKPMNALALLEAGVDPNAVYAHSLTALMWAAGYGHTETVRSLLAAGARVDLKDDRGKTALDIAREDNFSETIKVLEAASKNRAP